MNWFKTYIEKDRGINNAFSEWGTYYHHLMQQLIQGELFEFELKDKYNEMIKTCEHKFPPNKYVDLREKTYFGVMEHFDDFSWYEQFKILSCEENRQYDLKGIPFVSIADAEVEKIKTKEMGILDHKISKVFTKKDLSKKLKQLYVYSYSFKDVYGKYPEILTFNHFKENKVVIHNFDKKEYDKTIKWLINKIEYISKQTEFIPRCLQVEDKTKDWYALYLCNHRKTCEYRPYIKNN